VVAPGDGVVVKIIDIDAERRRLSLSMKRVGPNEQPLPPIALIPGDEPLLPVPGPAERMAAEAADAGYDDEGGQYATDVDDGAIDPGAGAGADEGDQYASDADEGPVDSAADAAAEEDADPADPADAPAGGTDADVALEGDVPTLADPVPAGEVDATLSAVGGEAAPADEQPGEG
jgi:small subunit ribosomal protein S1